MSILDENAELYLKKDSKGHMVEILLRGADIKSIDFGCKMVNCIEERLAEII